MAALGFASRESTWADAEEALLNLNPCLPSILPTRKFHRIELHILNEFPMELIPEFAEQILNSSKKDYVPVSVPVIK